MVGLIVLWKNNFVVIEKSDFADVLSWVDRDKKVVTSLGFTSWRYFLYQLAVFSMDNQLAVYPLALG